MTRRVTSGAVEAAAACARTAARLTNISFFMSKLDHASRNAVSEPRAKIVKEMSERICCWRDRRCPVPYFWDDTAVVPPVGSDDDSKTNGARCATEQLPLLRSARARLRCHPVDLESGRAKDLRDSALQFPRRGLDGKNFRGPSALSDHLHLRRHFHGGVRLRRVPARDLARVFRVRDFVVDGFVYRLDSGRAGLAEPGGVRGGLLPGSPFHRREPDPGLAPGLPELLTARANQTLDGRPQA